MQRTGRRLAIAATMIVAAGLPAMLQRARAETPQAAAAPSGAEAEGIIFERQQIMLQLDKDSETLGDIMAGTEPPAKLAETTRAIAQGAKDSLAAFQAKVPGGRSKPEVWSQYDDFMKRMQAFADNSAKMAERGQAGDLNGVTALAIDAMPCKQCHDVYRAPKKPGGHG
jgi:cytochrome c556